MPMQITQVFIIIVIFEALFDVDPRLKNCGNDDPELST